MPPRTAWIISGPGCLMLYEPIVMGWEAGGPTARTSAHQNHTPCATPSFACRTMPQNQAGDDPSGHSITESASGKNRTHEEMDELLQMQTERADAAEKRAEAAEQRALAAERTVRRNARKLEGWRSKNSAGRKAVRRAKEGMFTQTMGIRKDGTVDRLYTVQVAGGREGKRKAIDEQWVKQSGALRGRKGNIGGLEYTMSELIAAHREIQEEGLGSRATLAERRTDDAHRRAQEVRVLLPASNKSRRDLQGPINTFVRPCEQTMRAFHLAASLVAFSKVPEIAEKANSITPSADGKSFGVHHALGCATDFLTMNEVTKDAFGQPHYEATKHSLCMPLQQAPNKIASDVKDRDGNSYTLVTPQIFGTMATLANMDCVYARFSNKVTGASDAAADNRGQGNLKRAMDAMCSQGSILYSATVDRSMWADARQLINGVGLYVPLKRFYERRDIKGLILELQQRRLALRKERELAALPRLLQKRAARMAAEKAALNSDKAAQDADDLASQALQLGTAEAQVKAANARKTAAEALATALEKRDLFVKILTRKRKPRKGLVVPSKDASASSLVDNNTPPVEAAVDPDAPSSVAAGAVDAPVPAACNAPHGNASSSIAAIDTSADAPAVAANDAPDSAAGPGHTSDSQADPTSGDLFDLADALQPRRPPIQLDVGGAVQKCPKAMERLFQRTMYEILLRPVLKFHRFLRWFMRVWYIMAQERCLIKDQTLGRIEYLRCLRAVFRIWFNATVDHGTVGRKRRRQALLGLPRRTWLRLERPKETEPEMVKARNLQLHVLEVRATENGGGYTVWSELERKQQFGGPRDHAMALVRRARIKRCDDWGRSLYGSFWRDMGAQLVDSWLRCRDLGNAFGIAWCDAWIPPTTARSDGHNSESLLPVPPCNVAPQSDAAACPFQHSAVQSQTVRSLKRRRFVGSQVGLGQELKFWGLLCCMVGMVEQGEETDDLSILELENGSLLGNAVLKANNFRSLFWSKRPATAHHGVSMQANPARFWGCYDQRVQDKDGTFSIQEIGIGCQCVSHRQHNASGRMVNMMDREFLDKVVSVVTQLHDDNVKGHVISNAMHFLFQNEELDRKTTFYSDCRQEINRKASSEDEESEDPEDPGPSMQQIGMHVDKDTGLAPPDPCAIVRWATVQKSASCLDMHCDLYAFGYGRLRGIGKTDHDEVRALTSIFSRRGFVSEDHPNWKLTQKAGPFFKFLTAPESKTQLAIVRFISKAVVEPLLAVANEPNLCSSLMMGTCSFPRVLLRILSDVIWSATGQRKRLPKICHRSDGAGVEWDSGSWTKDATPPIKKCFGSLRLLNPKCGPAVRRELEKVFDKDWNPAMQDDIVTAVEELVLKFKRIAAMHGRAIPDTARMIFASVYPHLYNKDGGLVHQFESKLAGSHAARQTLDIEDSFPVKMAQLTFMFKLTILDVLWEIKDMHRRELQSLDSFVGGMAKTVWTNQKVDGRRILAAHASALADAVIVKVMGRDVLAHFKDKFCGQLAGRNPLEFFPGFASLWGDLSKEVDAFSGVVEPEELQLSTRSRSQSAGEAAVVEPDNADGEAGARVDLALARSDSEGGNATDAVGTVITGGPPSAKPIPVHYNRVDSLGAKGPEGNHIMFVDGKDMFPKPLSAYPSIHRAVLRAATLSNSSKRIEHPWARMAQLYATRTRANFFTLCLYFMISNDLTMGMDIEALARDDPVFLEAALELAKHDGWEKLFELDQIKRDTMLADYKRAQADKKGAKFWKETHHDGSYRTDRWLEFKPEEEGAFQRRINVVKLRLGLPCEARVPRPLRKQGEERGPTATRQRQAAVPAATRQQQAAGQQSSRTAESCLEDLTMFEHGLVGIECEGDLDAAASAVERDIVMEALDNCESAMVVLDTEMTDQNDCGPLRQRERHEDSAESVLSASACEDGRGVAASLVIRRSSRLAVAAERATLQHEAVRDYNFATETDAEMAVSGSGSDAADAGGKAVPPAAAEEGEMLSEGAAANLVPDVEMAETSAIGAATRDGKALADGAEAAREADSDSDDGSECENDAESDPDTDLESPESDSERFGEIELKPEDIWKVDFCWKVFNAVSPRWPRHKNNVWAHSVVSVQKNTGLGSDGRLVAHVTRQPTARLKLLLNELDIAISAASIKFKVEMGSANKAYILYNDYAGLQLVRVTNIERPKSKLSRGEDEWEGTLTFRRLMTTEEAMGTCDSMNDEGSYLGTRSLRKILREDEKRHRVTYHEGYCIYKGNLRELIGVVYLRQAKSSESDVSREDYPLADILRVGGYAHEKAA